jgi:DnaK suppressor protein
MAEKKAKKKDIKKTVGKKVKTAVKKSPSRAKPRVSGKSKQAAKKSTVKRTIPKPKPRTTGKSKPASTKSAAKKTILKLKPKTTGKSKPASIKSAVKKTILKPKLKTTGKISRPKKTGYQESEAERKAALRKTLIAKRESIVKEAKSEISKYIKGETRQLVDTALDDGDWSVVDLSEDISLRQLGTHKDTLRKIDEALRKLDEGTYGICEDCGEEISEERLKILPFAIYCTDCQERREQLEEIEKEKA